MAELLASKKGPTATAGAAGRTDETLRDAGQEQAAELVGAASERQLSNELELAAVAGMRCWLIYWTACLTRSRATAGPWTLRAGQRISTRSAIALVSAARRWSARIRPGRARGRREEEERLAATAG